MFTGLIQDIGQVVDIRPGATNTRLGVKTGMNLTEVALGDSIAIDGYCQTVVEIRGNVFYVDVSPETLERTTAKDLKVGAAVNLEPALRMSDRLGGHFVSGHVDGVGTVQKLDKTSEFWIFRIKADPSVIKLCVEKGSIAVSGISLTVNKVGEDWFEIGIIPHTAKETTLGNLKIGDKVNLETDMIGKYIQRLLSAMAGQQADHEEEKINLTFLAKHGFLK